MKKTMMRSVILMMMMMMTCAVTSSEDAPFIVAHKKAILTRLKPGIERVSVSIDIYNHGSATAYDVSLNDDSWSKDIFDIVSGNTSISWERLDVGSVVSHNLELESKVQGPYYGAPAVIKFRIPTKAALQEAYSTPIMPLDILADRPSENKLDLAKRMLAKYGSLVSVVSLVTLFVYLVASPTKTSASKGTKKKR